MKRITLASARLAAFLFALAFTMPGCKKAETVDASQYNATTWEAAVNNPFLSDQEFTKLYAQALAAELKDARVEITGDRTISLKLADGSQMTVYLDNAWNEAVQSPANRVEIIRRYVAAIGSSTTAPGEAGTPLDTNSIVAVVRDDRYMQNFAPYEGTSNAVVSEPLVADIHVVYAFDTTNGIHYLMEYHRQALGMDLPSLHKLALVNLHRILTKVGRVGDGPAYGIVADGNYESSLLLANKLWDEQASAVQGDIVAAVPSRDTLLFTGSGSPEGIKQLQQAVDKIQQGGDHLISKTLLIRRNGHWEKYTN